MSQLDNKPPAPVFRYKFTQEFMDSLHIFSKVHQYDDRKVFKAAWTTWVSENESDINQEIKRLTVLGYDGDIVDKMFKSARYYFRKKSDIRVEPKERKQYIGVHKDLLDSIDLHIVEHSGLNDYTPATGFVHFCNQNVPLLKQEIDRFVAQQTIIDSHAFYEKIKKTYKNRYFMKINK